MFLESENAMTHKNGRRITAVVLLILTGLLFAGCGQDKTSDKLSGVWKQDTGKEGYTQYYSFEEDGTFRSFTGVAEDSQDADVYQTGTYKLNGTKLTITVDKQYIDWDAAFGVRAWMTTTGTADKYPEYTLSFDGDTLNLKYSSDGVQQDLTWTKQNGKLSTYVYKWEDLNRLLSTD